MMSSINNDDPIFHHDAWLKKVYPKGRPKTVWQVLLFKFPPKKKKG